MFSNYTLGEGYLWKMKRIGNILFYGALIFVFLHTGTRSWILQQVISTGLFNQEIEPSEQKITPSQQFSFVDQQGRTFAGTDLKGKVVFINFWATWCPPCRGEMPSLNELYNELKDHPGIFFLFINEDENPGKATSFLKEKNYSLPFYAMGGTAPAEMFSGTLPTTVVLDKEGRIVLKHEGIGNFNNKAFIEQLKDLAK